MRESGVCGEIRKSCKGTGCRGKRQRQRSRKLEGNSAGETEGGERSFGS